ncbi:hypothetical protein C8P63_1307 [Melghirimyces profundicolus]|uniref:Uncharacterized protein n=1 Tax=Melghirimyces profundicolus TaxID=1242148 RepID=A0A2T6B9E1_9BACL|nr:hypothetical protein [Melghirimyces profundicolus]PTX52695.1 hypothetical protein C8P63_1307 [Melghirimyces profundicolus]
MEAEKYKKIRSHLDPVHRNKDKVNRESVHGTRVYIHPKPHAMYYTEGRNISLVETIKGPHDFREYLKQAASGKEEDLPKGESFMNWQEKYIDKLDRDMNDMKNTITSSEDRIARMIDSAMTEMRDRDNQRHQEIIEMRNSMQNVEQKIESKMRWVVGTAITTGLSVVAIAITIIVAVWQIITTLTESTP